MDTKDIERIRVARLEIDDCNDADARVKYGQLRGVFDAFMSDYHADSYDSHELLLRHMALEKKHAVLKEALCDLESELRSRGVEL